jgi:hypothetical protein
MASYQFIDEHAGDDDVTMRAGAVLASKYVVVCLGTTQGQVILPTAITDVPYGILQTTAAAIGDPVVIRPIGSGRRSLVRAQAAFGLGDALGLADDGTLGEVDTAVKYNYPIGIALMAATANADVVACQLIGSLIPRA